MSTELVIIEKLKLDLVPFFTKGDRLDELLDAIKVDIMAHVPDVSTPKGRTLIKNNITAGKKYRLHLEESGKKLSAEYKLIPSAIDATRKKANEFLLGVEAKARERLTEWELTDKAEKKQISDTAAYLIKFAADLEDGYRDNELIDFKIEQAEADRQAEIKAAADKAAADAKAKAESEAAGKIAKANSDRIEAEQREAKAKQDIIDAQAKAEQAEIDKVAAEEARKELVRVDYHERMIQHIVGCGNGLIGGSPQPFGLLFYELENKIVIDESFEEFRAAAELAKNEAIQKLKDCQEKQAKDREEAEAKAKHDAEVAADYATRVESKRHQDAAEKLESERKAREADKNHKHQVKLDAMNDFINAGLDMESAKKAVRALVAHKIRRGVINF